MISGIQRGFTQSFLFLLAAALFLVPRARAQVLTPDTMTLIGTGASGKAIFTSLPDCPVNLRVFVQDTNIVSVTPLTAGPVTAQVFTVTGLQVGNTIVRVDFAGTSPLCTNTGSRFLTVHVIERPVIVQQPASQSVAAGTDVAFGVVATGNLLRYQWRLNGLNILGATGNTLGIPNAQPTNAGDYSVTVYNAAGVVNSDSAKLTVTNVSTLPFTDNFDGPGNGISGAVGLGLGANSGSTREPGEPLHAGEKGTNSVWLTWRAPASGIVVLSTLGSDFDTVLAVYTGPGTDFASLVPVACDNDSGSNGKTSKTIFQVTQDTVYYIAVDGVEGADGTAELNYNLGVPPAITQQPSSRTVSPGSSVTLSVTATGTPGPFYQWSLNQAELNNATNGSLTITNFQSASEGDYRVVVSNFAGSVASVPATVLLDSPLRMGALGMNGNGQFQLRLIGQGGTNYVLQASSNLITWVSLVTNAAPSGIWDFLDASGSNFSYRFYKATLGP